MDYKVQIKLYKMNNKTNKTYKKMRRKIIKAMKQKKLNRIYKRMRGRIIKAMRIIKTMKVKKM